MKHKRIISVLTAAGCIAAMMTVMPVSVQATEIVHNDFEINYGGWYAESPDDSAYLDAAAGIGFGSSRGMLISGRTSPSDGAVSEKDLYLIGGEQYDYAVSVFSRTPQTFTLTLTTFDSKTGKETVKVLDKQYAKGGEWLTLSASYKAPLNSQSFKLRITTDTTDDFIFDNVSVKGYKGLTAYAAEKGLKDELVNYGIRSGNLLNGATINNDTIKNLILKDNNAVECENETKPDATLVQNGSTNTDIKVRDSSFAKIADWCAKNGIAFRGHTLVWHGQTPEWFFKENFQKDGKWVSESVMDQRLESYIKNMFAMYAKNYPNLNLYAYDVCNECVSDDSNRTANFGGAREPGYGNGKSPWVQIYGSNVFVEKAFAYAKQYAPATCKLFYNDYNEYAGHKRDCIYNMCKKIYEQGNLDGVGMQSHINASWDGFSGYDAYVTAMKKYLSIGCDVQITEMDVNVKSGTTLDDQAKKYKAILQAAMDWNKQHKDGGHVTLFQIWGPNDANSWLGRDAKGTLYDVNNNPKAAYTAVTSIIPQSEWGDGTKFSDDFTPPALEPISGTLIKELTVNDSANASDWSILTGLRRGDAVYGDRDITATSVPEKLANAEFVKTACDSKMYSEDLGVFTAAADINVYLAVDDRVNSSLDWLSTWTKTSDVVTTSNGVTLELFKKTVKSGETVTLGTNGGKGESANYLVFALRPADEFNLGDVDHDSAISAKDLTIAKRIALGKADMNSAADVNCDGAVDKTDIEWYVQYLTGQTNAFPEKVVQAVQHMDGKTYMAQIRQTLTNTAEPNGATAENAGTAYGTYKKETIYSDVCKRNKSFNVLIPAGYTTNKQYPVMYCMHGYWGDEDALLDKGDASLRLRQIIGNAIASGEAEDMIVVFPDIYASATQDKCNALDDKNNAAYDNFINLLTKEIMPFMEKNYSIKTGRENTAITGFSMGGRESLYIGFTRPDLFGYIGAMCPAPGVPLQNSQFTFRQDEQPYLLHVSAGSNDTLIYSTPEGYHNTMTQVGTDHIWHYVQGGDHGGKTIRPHMYYFVREVFKA